MKLMMHLVAEFIHMVTAAFLIVILFLGGWHFWGLTGTQEVAAWPIALLRIVVLLAKVGAVILFFMLVRLELAAVPLRPAHGHRLESDAPVGNGQRDPGSRLGWYARRSALAGNLQYPGHGRPGARCLIVSWLTVTLMDPTARALRGSSWRWLPRIESDGRAGR